MTDDQDEILAFLRQPEQAKLVRKAANYHTAIKRRAKPPGTPAKPKPCEWCGVEFSGRAMRDHWPVCPLNPKSHRNKQKAKGI